MFDDILGDIKAAKYEKAYDKLKKILEKDPDNNKAGEFVENCCYLWALTEASKASFSLEAENVAESKINYAIDLSPRIRKMSEKEKIKYHAVKLNDIAFALYKMALDCLSKGSDKGGNLFFDLSGGVFQGASRKCPFALEIRNSRAKYKQAFNKLDFLTAQSLLNCYGIYEDEQIAGSNGPVQEAVGVKQLSCPVTILITIILIVMVHYVFVNYYVPYSKNKVAKNSVSTINWNDLINKNDISKIKKAIEEKADLNAKDINGGTPLIKAASIGNYDIVNLLIENKADVNMSCNAGWTPLMYASNAGHLKVVKLLVDKNAFMNIKNKDKATALTIAIKAKRKDVIEYLKSWGGIE